MPYKYNSCFPQLPNGHFSCGILWQTVSAFFCNSVFYLVISMDIPGEMKFQSAKVLQKTPPKQILQKKMSLGKRPAVAIHGNMEIVQQKCPNGCFSSYSAQIGKIVSILLIKKIPDLGIVRFPFSLFLCIFMQWMQWSCFVFEYIRGAYLCIKYI